MLSVLCLVLGAVVNVGVNVAIALRVDIGAPGFQERYAPVVWPATRQLALSDPEGGSLEWQLMRDTYGETVAIVWRIAVRSDGPSGPPMQGWTPAGSIPPGWWPFEPPTFEEMGDQTFVRHAALTSGWPMQSAWCDYRVFDGATIDPEDRAPGLAGGVILGSGGWGPNSIPKILPLRPRYPGFLVNTIFYAAAVALLIAAVRTPWVIRDARRRRRGACADCGYQLGASGTCSECGTETARGTAAPA